MFDINSPMPPIWIMYPHITQYSIGWRMGYGEGYKYDLIDWLATLSKEDQIHYKTMFPQPIFWKDLSFWEDMDEDDDDIEEDDDGQEFWVNDVLIQFWTEDGKLKYSKDMYIDKLASQKKQFISISNKYLEKSYNSPFTVDINTFCCLEHYIIAQKSLMFADKEIYKKIMETTDLNEIKKLEARIKNVDSSVWDKYINTIILTGNYYKFTQNKVIRDYLFSTEDALLISEDSQFFDLNRWEDQNLEGFALMEVRDELRRIYKYFDNIDWSKLSDYLSERK